jgi:hypothetical protein
MHFSKQQEDSSNGISKHSSSKPNLSQQNPHPNCTKLACEDNLHFIFAHPCTCKASKPNTYYQIIKSVNAARTEHTQAVCLPTQHARPFA